jgi:hypothetical protein
MKKLISLGFVLTALYLISCSKDGDNDNGNDEKMDLITSAAWKYDTAGVDLSGDGNIDQALPAGLVDDCERDNLVTFNDDGTGTVDEGGSKCDAGDPQSTSLTWQFKNNQTVLNIPDTLYGKFTGDAQIKELSATKLKLIKEITITDPITMTVDVVIELKH